MTSQSVRGVLVLSAVCLSVLACGPSQLPPKPIGEACSPTLAPGETASECADGLCVGLDNYSGFCTRSCTEDSKCPGDFKCEAAGQYGKICKPLTGCKTDQECPAGHSCNAETGNCYIKVSRTLCSPCQDALQCPAGGTCFTAFGTGEQFCTGPCGLEGECAVGFECKSVPAGKAAALIQQCVPKAQTCSQGKTMCAPCKGDSECGGFFDLCVRNVVSGEMFCGRDCDPARTGDCPSGFACVDIGQSDDPNVKGPFQCVPNSNTCEDYCDARDELGQIRQCGLGQECDADRQVCRPSTDGRECAPCITNDDCKKGAHPENRCLVNDCADCPFKGESFCATPCADDEACVTSFGPGFVCRLVADGASTPRKYCLPQRGSCASGLGRLGDDCSVNGAQDCVAGVCLVAGSTSLCSMACSADADCGNNSFRCCEYSPAGGYDCADSLRTPSGPASGSGVCAPLGGLFGDDCSPGRPPCQTGTCLDLGTARVCTVPCSGSCPGGFTCRGAQAPGGVPVDICFPAGGGKAGAVCSFGPAACESGLCIRKDSGPICTQSCKVDLDCLEGWLCSPVATVDNRTVQACLPPSLQ